ncbi:MAG: phosphopantetheine-binding protein [Verrucomicrobia bacterium]|nr:phosphopantetheine-binding protein [Verrucomicrobiota bacterium]
MAETPDAIAKKEAKLLGILASDILELGPDFKCTDDLFEAGLDSMAIMRLLIHVETAFGCRLPVSQVNRENFSTVQKIAALIPAE